MSRQLKNYINGQWVASSATDYLDVENPATGEILAQVPMNTAADMNTAARHASEAFEGWRRTPAGTRIQSLFKLKQVLEDHFDEIAQLITTECGKTFKESQGEMVRAIENVEVACGIPKMMQGDISEDIARGIDELMIRQPVGVSGCIAPFNFPGMITFWFLPYAIACGNPFIVKPSEKVPLTMERIFQLVDEHLDLPAGVLQMVHGGKEAVDAMLDHPVIRAISFVGSTPVAKYVYSRGTANGKRVQ
ncbi:MAG: aldehyde dehydrogenase family protein, partial [Chloroflexota bacterium]